MKNREIVDYTIVKGLAVDVERQVRRLLKSGWKVRGKLIKINSKANRVDLLVQNMVLYIND